MSMIRLGILPWCCVTLQLWQYPEVSGAYAIKLTPTASQDAVSGAQEMLIRTTFSAPPAATPSCYSGMSKTPPTYQRITSVHCPAS